MSAQGKVMVDYSHLSFQTASKVLLEVDVMKVLALFIKKTGFYHI